MIVRRRKWELFVKTTVLLLIAGKASCSRQWYEKPRRSFIDYSIFDGQQPVYFAGPVVQSSLRSSSDERNTRKIIGYPQALPARNDMQSDPKFVFPDYRVESRSFAPGSAPSCKGATFCENVPDYPMELVNNVLKNDRTLHSYENIDVIDSIAQRMDTSDSESLCVSTERVVYPKSAETMDKEWLFVVNHPNYTQGVRVETCSDEGTGCKMIEGFAEGYKTSCSQKYIYRELTAIVADGSVGHKLFRFPASCCCHVQFTAAAGRFGSASPDGAGPR